jgi:hypothetical protein
VTCLTQRSSGHKRFPKAVAQRGPESRELIDDCTRHRSVV